MIVYCDIQTGEIKEMYPGFELHAKLESSKAKRVAVLCKYLRSFKDFLYSKRVRGEMYFSVMCEHDLAGREFDRIERAHDWHQLKNVGLLEEYLSRRIK